MMKKVLIFICFDDNCHFCSQVVPSLENHTFDPLILNVCRGDFKGLHCIIMRYTFKRFINSCLITNFVGIFKNSNNFLISYFITVVFFIQPSRSSAVLFSHSGVSCTQGKVILHLRTFPSPNNLFHDFAIVDALTEFNRALFVS